MKRSYELRWSGQKRRHTVKTQKRGREAMKAWKRWYERQGWWVTSVAQGYGYIARPPEWREDPLPGPRRAIVLREVF